MKNNQFTITIEKQPQRCEICHQVDRFDADNGQCSRCQAVNSAVLAAEHAPPEWKPLFIELTEQMTPVQIGLLLLLIGVISGMMIDITHIKVGFSSLLAILISMLASIPLLTKQAKNFHPILSSLLITLTIAPLGWLLLVLLYWFIYSLM